MGPMALTLEELGGFLAAVGMPCEVDGDGAVVTISSVATLEEAREGQISFLSNQSMPRI